MINNSKLNNIFVCNINRAENMVKPYHVNRINGYNNYDLHLFANWLHLNRMILELFIRYKITTVNYNCQSYHLEHYQFEFDLDCVWNLNNRNSLCLDRAFNWNQIKTTESILRLIKPKPNPIKANKSEFIYNNAKQFQIDVMHRAVGS